VKVLFIHPNFPAQFRYVAAALGRAPGAEVVFATENPRPDWDIPGVQKAVYKVDARPNPATHPLARGFEIAVKRGQGMLRVIAELKNQGFTPDLVYAHSGWGSSLFIKDAFPNSPLLGYFEWYYHARGSDADFDPADPLNDFAVASIRTRNAPILIDLAAADKGLTPTAWQVAQFPADFKPKLTQLHDGIDASYFTPDPEAEPDLPGVDLAGARQIVTYASRGLEPYRGFPQFMEALQYVLEARPDCHAVIAGEDRVVYGKTLENGKTYKQDCLEKLDLDMSRVHFVGALPYGKYKRLLQASSVHVYLTRPFVLSWSMLEAMACGCVVVASGTPPVKEVIKDGVNGLLTPFFAPQKIAEKIIHALENQKDMQPVREAARKTIEDSYCLEKLLPLHLQLLADTAGKKTRFKAHVGAQPPRFGPG